MVTLEGEFVFANCGCSKDRPWSWFVIEMQIWSSHIFVSCENWWFGPHSWSEHPAHAMSLSEGSSSWKSTAVVAGFRLAKMGMGQNLWHMGTYEWKDEHSQSRSCFELKTKRIPGSWPIPKSERPGTETCSDLKWFEERKANLYICSTLEYTHRSLNQWSVSMFSTSHWIIPWPKPCLGCATCGTAPTTTSSARLHRSRSSTKPPVTGPPPSWASFIKTPRCAACGWSATAWICRAVGSCWAWCGGSQPALVALVAGLATSWAAGWCRCTPCRPWTRRHIHRAVDWWRAWMSLGRSSRGLLRHRRSGWGSESLGKSRWWELRRCTSCKKCCHKGAWKIDSLALFFLKGWLLQCKVIPFDLKKTRLAGSLYFVSWELHACAIHLARSMAPLLSHRHII